ncbi:MAG: DUF4040 domain-containing protein [Candidatus Omnitrophica bacterium]|nr:DUF4040 domain-containing protein [Candidatus Omnitrophota bacterium]
MFELIFLLLIFCIIGALVAVETRDLLSAIIALGAVGFGLSIIFLLLKAPDIAITQIVVEILCLVVLIRATISRDLTTISGDREFFGMIATVVLLFVAFLFGLEVLRELPQFGAPLFTKAPGAVTNVYLTEGLAKTGAANIVTAILLDFRAYDTLGEATVLFTSILGAMAILRIRSRKKVRD